MTKVDILHEVKSILAHETDFLTTKKVAASFWIETRLKKTRKATETYFEDAL